MVSVAHKARQLSRVLGSVPSLIYGALYLLAIPIFALVYTFLPSEFYQPTAQYEGERANNKAMDGLMKQLDDHLSSGFINQFGWEYDKASLYIVGHVGAEKGFEVSGQFSATNTADKTTRDFNFRVENGFERLATGVPTWDRIKSYVFLHGDMPIPVNRLFPCPPDMRAPAGGFRDDVQKVGCVLLSRDTAERMYADRRVKEGFPAGKEQFWRMLYFSAITISTLGYGDIVPLSDRARGLVTVEVIIGPLLFGLFLNSVVREGSQQSNQ